MTAGNQSSLNGGTRQPMSGRTPFSMIAWVHRLVVSPKRAAPSFRAGLSARRLQCPFEGATNVDGVRQPASSGRCWLPGAPCGRLRTDPPQGLRSSGVRGGRARLQRKPTIPGGTVMSATETFGRSGGSVRRTAPFQWVYSSSETIAHDVVQRHLPGCMQSRRRQGQV
jgi:hypothetical protein